MWGLLGYFPSLILILMWHFAQDCNRQQCGQYVWYIERVGLKCKELVQYSDCGGECGPQLLPTGRAVRVDRRALRPHHCTATEGFGPCQKDMGRLPLCESHSPCIVEVTVQVCALHSVNCLSFHTKFVDVDNFLVNRQTLKVLVNEKK